jgi:hypothetical protein
MSKSQYSTTIQQLKTSILEWLRNRLSGDKTEWLEMTGNKLIKGAEDWELFTSFSAVPRYTGKEALKLTETERKEAELHRPGWYPEDWSIDQIGRVYLVLCYAEQKKEEFLDRLEKLFVTSDMGEAEALYKGLCIYPYPEELKLRAAEGVRSNITTVFNAVALNNPYPGEYLDTEPWNQIVLKALFVGSPLYKIKGIDDRANETLARILVEYAHERRSAGRNVSPELWRCVGPFIGKDIIEDIKWVLNRPDSIQKQAGVLALQSSNYPDKDVLLEKYRETVDEVERNQITWNKIGSLYEAVQTN